MTVAATLATAPLIAFHFETLSTTTLVANVLALPAVAPAMWLGMCSAGLAQVPGVPLEPLNGLDALLLAYVAQVAAWCAAPGWAELQVHLGGVGAGRRLSRLAAALALLCLRWRWPLAALRALAARRARACSVAACLVGLPGGAAAAPPHGPAGRGSRRRPGRRDPAPARAARPPSSSTAGRRGTAWRASSSRPGSTASAPRSSPTTSPTTRAASRSCSARCRSDGCSSRRLQPRADRGGGRAAGADPERIAAGQELRSGALRLRGPLAARASCWRRRAGEDPNQLALVMDARWRDFSDAADRRRRGRGGAARPGAGRRPQGRPSRQRRRRARRAAGADAAAAGGDLGR